MNKDTESQKWGRLMNGNLASAEKHRIAYGEAMYNQAIEEALQQVEKYNTGKELTPIVTAIINSIKQLKK